MSLVLELPPELESELAAEAAQLRLSLSDYALRLLSLGRTPGAEPRNGTELVAYWQMPGWSARDRTSTMPRYTLEISGESANKESERSKWICSIPTY